MTPDTNRPPRWAQKLLTRLHPEDTLEEVEGDLEELYEYWLEREGKTRAVMRYLLNVVTVLPPFVRKRKNEKDYYTPSNFRPDMIRNYFKIAFRSLVKHKTFSLINILGLALGMTCAVFIMLWVQDERQVDAFHKNDKHLYSVFQRIQREGEIIGSRATPGLLGSALKQEIPEIEMASEFAWNSSHTFQSGNKVFKFDCNAAEPDFFSLFSFNILEGTASTALSNPDNLAISRDMADALFGSAAKAIGKPVRFENREVYTVSAVFELPSNSTLRFDCVRTWKAFVKDNPWLDSFTDMGPTLVVKLDDKAEASQVETKIKSFLNDKIASETQQESRELGLQKFSETYLYGSFTNGQIDGGRIGYIRIFSFFALFVLLIACINFMNLATARAASRAKEIGVRKTMGALKSVLIGQFMGESFLLSFFATLTAIVLIFCLLPVFNTLSGKQLADLTEQSQFWYYVVGSFLFAGFIAGCYPAFFMASFKPIRVLKGDLKFGTKSIVFRKGLVVFQFSISVIMIIGMIVIYRQLDYIQKTNLGFSRENLVYLPIEGELGKNLAVFNEKTAVQVSIKDVTYISQIPTDINNFQGEMDWSGRNPNLDIQYTGVDVSYDFVKTMGLQMNEGRDFDKKFASDSLNFLINEATLRATGIKNPINHPFKIHGVSGKIIGVLKDFNFRPLHREITPLVVRLKPTPRGTALIRLAAGKTQEGIAALEKICKELNPQFPFSYEFADENFNRFYKSEQVVGNLVNYFGFIAIFISCLGLFGLATFTAEQRTKEIGVRKVLGASVASVVTLLSKDFLKLVLIALVIASPLAYYVMKGWLADFAYRINIEWWMFALAGLLAICIALLTVSFQSIKAALMNPVRSLKSE